MYSSAEDYMAGKPGIYKYSEVIDLPINEDTKRMSEVISGVIQAIETRQVNGGKTAYNLRVGGESYGAGLYAPKAKEGDYITFTVDRSRGYANVERGTLKVGKAPKGEPAPSASPAPTAKASYGSFDARQDAISRQAASNTAIAFLDLLIKHELIALPKTKKQEATETYLHKYEQMFYERNTGVAWKDISPNKVVEEEDSEEEIETPDDEQWG